MNGYSGFRKFTMCSVTKGDDVDKTHQRSAACAEKEANPAHVACNVTAFFLFQEKRNLHISSLSWKVKRYNLDCLYSEDVFIIMNSGINQCSVT